MLRATSLALVLWLGSGASQALRSQPPLKVGDPAPPFSLLGSDGRTYRLADYAGKQVVVLAWFAKAFTSG
jgi:thioredoxin-dependent peroxiredoxin